MVEESWWTKAAGAMPTLQPTFPQRYNNSSSGGVPSDRRVTQAAGSGTPAYKRSSAKTHEDAAEVPAGYNDDDMSERGSTASGNQRKGAAEWKNWENRRGREYQSSRQPPQRRGGKGGRFDTAAI